MKMFNCRFSIEIFICYNFLFIVELFDTFFSLNTPTPMKRTVIIPSIRQTHLLFLRLSPTAKETKRKQTKNRKKKVRTKKKDSEEERKHFAFYFALKFYLSPTRIKHNRRHREWGTFLRVLL